MIVPMIMPILFIALLFDLIFTLTELTVVFLLTGGGPVDQTQVLANYALQVGCRAPSWARAQPSRCSCCPCCWC